MTHKSDVHLSGQGSWSSKLYSGIATLALLAMASVTQAQLGIPGSQILQQDAGGIAGAPATLEGFGRALAAGDFNGDGALDLAVGTPREAIAPTSEAGSVTVIYGGTTGLLPPNSEVWDLNGPAGQNAGTGDRFGQALAAADFDHDGFSDLAVGIPYRDVVAADLSIRPRAGAVLVLYGSAGGLVEAQAQYWRQGAGGIVGALEEDDFFGEALTSGDFDGDGFADLAIGVPGEDVGAVTNAGAVNVIYGSAAGLSTAPGTAANAIWTQGDLGSSQDEASDEFGRALAAGDWNDDGRDDLAVGAPRENWGAVIDAGAVFVILGSENGLTALGQQVRTQDDGGIPGEADPDDHFGSSLAAGDFDGDGVADLAVGSPGEQVAGETEIGLVHLLPGVPGLGVSNVASAMIDRSQVAAAAASGDRFGAALAAGDFDGGSADELVIAAPGAEVAGAASAGVIYIVSGLEPAAPELVGTFSQDGAVPGAVELGDSFGEVLAPGDFDGNGFADLAVGLPFEDVGAILDAGAVNVLYSQGLFRDGFESAGLAAWSSALQ